MCKEVQYFLGPVPKSLYFSDSKWINPSFYQNTLVKTEMEVFRRVFGRLQTHFGK